MSTGPQYNDCLQNIYDELYGPKSSEFCQYAYGNQSEIYEESEKYGWDLDKIDDTSFSQNMQECYADSGNLKLFCDDIYMLGYLGWESSEQVLDCYKKMDPISDEDVAEQEKKVECQAKKTAQDKYECLEIPTASIDFCYDKYLIDFKQTSDKKKLEEIDKCLLDNQRDPMLDQTILESGDASEIYGKDKGIASVQYFKTEIYRDLLKQIDEKRGLDGSLSCSLLLGEYYQMPQSTVSEIMAANETLNQAHECFIKEDFPFYLFGCDLKFQMDKDLDHVRDIGYYKSECMSGTSGFYYPQDQAKYVQGQLNLKLKKFEAKNYPGKEFFNYKDLRDFCARRFSNKEERLNCMIITDSIPDDFSADFCTQRIFSSSNKYFEYNLVHKHSCLKNRMIKEQFVEKSLQENIFSCLDDSKHLIAQQKCLEKQESKFMYITPFQKTFEPIIVNSRLIVKGKTFDYQLKLMERDLYVVANFEEDKIQQYVCDN